MHEKEFPGAISFSVAFTFKFTSELIMELILIFIMMKGNLYLENHIKKNVFANKTDVKYQIILFDSYMPNYRYLELFVWCAPPLPSIVLNIGFS